MTTLLQIHSGEGSPWHQFPDIEPAKDTPVLALLMGMPQVVIRSDDYLGGWAIIAVRNSEEYETIAFSPEDFSSGVTEDSWHILYWAHIDALRYVSIVRTQEGERD